MSRQRPDSDMPVTPPLEPGPSQGNPFRGDDVSGFQADFSRGWWGWGWLGLSSSHFFLLWRCEVCGWGLWRRWGLSDRKRWGGLQYSGRKPQHHQSSHCLRSRISLGVERRSAEIYITVLISTNTSTNTFTNTIFFFKFGQVMRVGKIFTRIFSNISTKLVCIWPRHWFILSTYTQSSS